MSNRFPVTADVRITLTSVGADLRVRGWAKNEIKVGGDAPRVKVDQDGQNVIITASGDCDISVPDHATLTIESVGADAKISEVYGDLKIGSVGADVSLREVGNVALNAVGADARIRQAKGDVQIGTIGADATLHEISGSVHIGAIGSDAYLREVEGGCIVNRVGSDLVLDIDFKPNAEYSFMAASDIICRVAPGANVQFLINAADGVIIDADDARTEDLESGQQVTLGTGEAHVKLVSSAEVRLVNETDSRRVFGTGFDMNIEFDMERAFEETARATERARRDAERASAQIQREVERTAEQVRRQATRAAEQAQREMERMQRNGGRGFNFGWSWGTEKPKRGFNAPMPPTPPTPPTPPRPPNMSRSAVLPDEPVTDNERLTILRMVESKQITVEEAERLLSALEGNK